MSPSYQRTGDERKDERQKKKLVVAKVKGERKETEKTTYEAHGHRPRRALSKRVLRRIARKNPNRSFAD